MMRNEATAKTYAYSGVLAPICESFIQEKRSIGHLYDTEAKRLSEFSGFTLDFEYPENMLTKEIVQAWISKKLYPKAFEQRVEMRNINDSPSGRNGNFIIFIEMSGIINPEEDLFNHPAPRKFSSLVGLDSL